MTIADDMAREVERIEKMWRAESEWDSVDTIATEIAQADLPLFAALSLLEIATEGPVKFCTRHVAALGALKGGPAFLSDILALASVIRGIKLGGLRAALRDMREREESDDD